MNATQSSRHTRAALRESAAAEERRLWLLISDPRTPPTERVTAYARWLEITRTLNELGTGPEPAKGSSDPT